MSTKIEYTIAMDRQAEVLERKVNRLIQEGWLPTGGLCSLDFIDVKWGPSDDPAQLGGRGMTIPPFSPCQCGGVAMLLKPNHPPTCWHCGKERSAQ